MTKTNFQDVARSSKYILIPIKFVVLFCIRHVIYLSRKREHAIISFRSNVSILNHKSIFELICLGQNIVG